MLTDAAKPILLGKQSFQMRKTVELPRGRRARERDTEKRAGVAMVGGDGALLAELKALRLRLAAEAKVPPYVICHDRTLIDLVQKRPQTEAALHEITGLGDRKIERYGADLLAVMWAQKRDARLNNRLSATINQTLALHIEGRSAEQIAQARGIEISTVRGHFAEAIEAGLIEARAVIGLDEAQIDEVIAAFEQCGTVDSGKLGAAHAALGGRYDYGILKCLLAELA